MSDYFICADVKTGLPDVRSYTLVLGGEPYRVNQCYGTDSYVDGLMDIVCAGVSLGRGESASYDRDLVNGLTIEDIVTYRPGTKIQFMSVNEDHHTEEILEFEIKGLDDIIARIIIENEIVNESEVDFNGHVHIGEGLKMSYGLIVRKTMKSIPYLLDHISVYDATTRKFYSSDSEISEYIRSFCSTTTNDTFKEFYSRFGETWGPIFCSIYEGNYTVVISQSEFSIVDNAIEIELRAMEKKIDDFIKEYPNSFPILVLHTWSDHGDKKRNGFSGNVGKLFKKFMEEERGGTLDPIMNLILTTIEKRGDPGTPDMFNKDDINVPQEKLEKVVTDIVSNGTDPNCIGGIIASIDGESNGVSFILIDVEGKPHPIYKDDEGSYYVDESYNSDEDDGSILPEDIHSIIDSSNENTDDDDDDNSNRI